MLLYSEHVRSQAEINFPKCTRTFEKGSNVNVATQYFSDGGFVNTEYFSVEGCRTESEEMI